MAAPNFVTQWRLLSGSKVDLTPLGGGDNPINFWTSDGDAMPLLQSLDDLRSSIISGTLVGFIAQNSPPSAISGSRYSIFVTGSTKDLIYNQNGSFVNLSAGASPFNTGGVRLFTDPNNGNDPTISSISSSYLQIFANYDTSSFGDLYIADTSNGVVFLELSDPTLFLGSNSGDVAAYAATEFNINAGLIRLQTGPYSGTGSLQISGSVGISGSVRADKLSVSGSYVVGTSRRAGLTLANTSGALGTNQQYSPLLELAGQGDGTVSLRSDAVRFAMQVVPVQGTNGPTGKLSFLSATGSDAYSEIMTLSTTGAPVFNSKVSSLSYFVTPAAGNGGLFNTAETQGLEVQMLGFAVAIYGGHLGPIGDVVYDLGSVSNRWATLFCNYQTSSLGARIGTLDFRTGSEIRGTNGAGVQLYSSTGNGSIIVDDLVNGAALNYSTNYLRVGSSVITFEVGSNSMRPNQDLVSSVGDSTHRLLNLYTAFVQNNGPLNLTPQAVTGQGAIVAVSGTMLVSGSLIAGLSSSTNIYNGGARTKVTRFSPANYTVLASDYIISVSGSSLTASVTMSLPNAAPEGTVYLFKDATNSASFSAGIHISASISKIDYGTNGVDIITRCGTVGLYSDGNNYFTI